MSHAMHHVQQRASPMLLLLPPVMLRLPVAIKDGLLIVLLTSTRQQLCGTRARGRTVPFRLHLARIRTAAATALTFCSCSPPSPLP